MAKSPKTSVGRRGFLKNAAAGAAGAAALATSTPLLEGQSQSGVRDAAPTNGVPAPTQKQLDREAGNIQPPVAARTITRPASDLMVQTVKELGIEFDEKNIADPAVAEELIRRGGKKQAPYLVDPDTNEEMYESDAIVEYLHQNFGE